MGRITLGRCSVGEGLGQTRDKSESLRNASEDGRPRARDGNDDSVAS